MEVLGQEGQVKEAVAVEQAPLEGLHLPQQQVMVEMVLRHQFPDHLFLMLVGVVVVLARQLTLEPEAQVGEETEQTHLELQLLERQIPEAVAVPKVVVHQEAEIMVLVAQAALA